MSETLTRRINPTPAQTWNRLHINHLDFAFPERAVPAGIEPPAKDVAALEMGGGEDLTNFLDEHTQTRTRIEIPEGSQGKTVVVEINADEGEIKATDVIVGKDASARIVVVAQGSASSQGLCGSSVRLIAHEHANVEYAEVVALDGEASYHANIGMSMAESAKLNSKQFVLAAKLATIGMVGETAGAQSAWDQSTRYLVSRDQTLDMNYVARMRGADSAADLVFSGVLSENAVKRLSDTIDLVHGCKGSKGHENEIVLVTGNDVINKALPSVMCNEDDVEGTHGATIGAISGEQLAYAENRGLSLEETETLFARAVYDEALIHAPEAAETILAAVTRVLGADTAEELADLHGIGVEV